MKAIVFTEYGPPEVLQVKEIKKPSPKDNQILIRIYATPINYGDITVRDFKSITPRKFSMPFPFWIISRLALGIRRPRIKTPGSEFAGEIEAIGKEVKKFKKGDKVFGYVSMAMGANAEYLCMPEKGTVTLKPDNMNFEEAAAVPYGSLMALNLLRKVNLQKGQKVLIIGASGGIGTGAVQIAKHFGAEVTGVCSTHKVEYVKALGVDNVIDYTKEDFTTDGETYDLIFDILGKSSFSQCKKLLAQNGRYLRASFKMKHVFQMLWTKIKGGKRVICALATDSAEDLVFIKELVEAGKIKTIIDKCFPMEQIVEAHNYYETGHPKGKVIITPSFL